ncbi:leucine-rich repeat protein, partial [Mycoplasmopsis bovis]|uniref:leucine-rich repeat protein n=1 Tax=Mycoplasmopsis bovis TaxID=28903 RepID=UPI003D298FF4
PEKLISFGGFKNWNISEIKFPETLRDIWAETLDYSKISEINLPSNLNSFGGFAGTKIKSIQFPESLKIIHQNTLDETKISKTS